MCGTRSSSIRATTFEVFFGFGLSNKSFNGLPIDSNWLATYYDQGPARGRHHHRPRPVFVLIAAWFQPAGPARALALFLVAYCVWSPRSPRPGSATPRRTFSSSPWPRRWCTRGLRVREHDEDPAGAQQVPLGRRPAARTGWSTRSSRRWPRPATTSTLFERRSDEIEDWPACKKAALPARVVWSRAAHRDLGRDAARVPPGRGPRAQHVPAAQPVGAVRLPGRGRAGRDHPAQLQAGSAPAATSSATARSATTAPAAIRPARRAARLLPRLPRGDRDRSAEHPRPPAALASTWSRPRVHLAVAARAAGRTRLPPGPDLRPLQLIPPHDGPDGRDGPQRGRYVGRLDAAKGAPLLMEGWDATARSPATTRCGWSSPAAARCWTSDRVGRRRGRRSSCAAC